MTSVKVVGVPVAVLMALALWSGALRAGADNPTGSLLVESNPAGASVYLDGRLAGETPLTVPTIAIGTHRVRVVRLGYLENNRLVTIKAGERASVRARLTDPAPQTAQNPALKIVVLEGEGAVNIIQQKTAVAPVIEVRDRNDQPVSGAVVKFAIQKGKASFDGARTLTVTTNAAGRATATGLTATSKGAVQIAASAAFQGQTAAATIAQTSVMTAAEASSIATGTSAASGGGLSHTAIAGILGGAGAGLTGAVLAAKSRAAHGTASLSDSGAAPVTYTGSFTAEELLSSGTNGVASCAWRMSYTGTMKMSLTTRQDGTVSGTADVQTTQYAVITQTLGPPPPDPRCFAYTPLVSTWSLPLTGTPTNLSFTGQKVNGASTNTLTFSGSLTTGVVTGSVTYTELTQGGGSSGSFSSGSATFAMTLR
jgi:PEGA domain